MLNETQKEKIARLRTKYEDSPESQSDIDAYESKLESLIADSGIASHPVFQEIIRKAIGRITDIDHLLSNDEELNDAKRSHLFGRKEELRFFLSKFSLSDEQRAIVFLEQTIDAKLTQ